MSTTDTAAQAGWYAIGGGRERYWDGWAWTELMRPVPHYVRVPPRDGVRLELASFSVPVDFTIN
jgi:hypothetical protein